MNTITLDVDDLMEGHHIKALKFGNVYRVTKLEWFPETVRVSMVDHEYPTVKTSRTFRLGTTVEIMPNCEWHNCHNLAVATSEHPTGISYWCAKHYETGSTVEELLQVPGCREADDECFGAIQENGLCFRHQPDDAGGW